MSVQGHLNATAREVSQVIEDVRISSAAHKDNLFV